MRLYKNKKSNIHRNGLSASVNIKKGQKIIQYIGKKVTIQKTESDPKYDNDKHIYLFTLNKRYDHDGDFKFNTARLINHSCEPNCEVLEDKGQLWIFALRDIKNISVKISMEAVELLIKNSVDKNKLEKLYTNSLDQAKNSLKHIKA